MSLRRLTYAFLLLLISFDLSAQKTEQTDSLVRLLGCDQLQQTEEFGFSYRKAMGHARFEHNSTLLVCDTAIWNVNSNIIKAFGNVRIIQNNTVLSSDRLDYRIDDNLAQFRGTLVQLQDKQKNTLRTKDLDYNTKDSVATFRNGGAMRDKDGQVIESNLGTYDSKIKTFNFVGNVDMYTDSIFIKTDKLDYNTSTSIAVFGTGTNAWKGSNMLSSSAGWYNRSRETFLFYRNVHLLTRNQEAWSDSLKYYKVPNDVEMFGHVELLDTTRNVSALAGYMQYVDSLSRITMTRDPVVIGITEQEGKRDTVHVGADTLIYWTVKRCDIPEGQVSAADGRLKEVDEDAVTAYRKKAADAAKAAAEEARKKMEEEDPNAAAARDRGNRNSASDANSAAPGSKATGTSAAGSKPAAAKGSGGGSPIRALKGAGVKPNLPGPFDDMPSLAPPMYVYQQPDTSKSVSGKAKNFTMKKDRPEHLKAAGDSLHVPTDSLHALSDSLHASGDTLHAKSDSISNGAASNAGTPKDTTKIGFVLGLSHVKVFRSDMQMACDSLTYCDLDSLIRLFKAPVVWNEVRRQYSADSITVVIHNQNLDKASLMSNAFIIIQEDSLCFDQIKGADMMAYFDTTGALKRFDALGDASGVFYIKEKDALATVNKFEAKMLTASFKNGDISDLNYFDNVKTDAYPVVQMKKDDRVLKGFEWQPERRPEGPSDITELTPRESERERYEKIRQPKFAQTDKYFPGYMAGVHKMLAQQDSLKRVRRAERQRLDRIRKAQEDSLAMAAKLDSLSLSEKPDSLQAVPDSLKMSFTDSLSKASSISNKNIAPDGDAISPDEEPVSAEPDSTSQALKAEDLILPFEKAKVETEKDRLKAQKDSLRAEAKAKHDEAVAAKKAKKEAKWAELDARDAAKAEKKAEKNKVKKRASTLKAVRARDVREAKEEEVLEQYMSRYEKKKAREDARKAKKIESKKNDTEADLIHEKGPAEEQIEKENGKKNKS